MPSCSRCGADFVLTKCKSRLCLPCKRKYDAAWRARRKAEGRPIVSTKMPREYHASYEAEYYTRQDVRGRRALAARRRRHDPAERPKHEARWQVSRALAAGRLHRQPCTICGESKAEAHHDDYSRPLDVRWLCRTHHREHHAKAEDR
jgi:hypothetical protein